MTRFDRLEDGSDAEIAFVVADSWQGRGLGGIMFHHLADRARDLGVRRFVAETLFHNRRMLSVFENSGLPVTHKADDGVVHVTIDLGTIGAPAGRPSGCDQSRPRLLEGRGHHDSPTQPRRPNP